MIFLIVTMLSKLSLKLGLLINVSDIAQVLWISKGFTNVTGLIRGWVAPLYLESSLVSMQISWLKIIFLMVASHRISLTLCLIFLKAEIQDWANERKNTYLWRYKVLLLDEILAPLRPRYSHVIWWFIIWRWSVSCCVKIFTCEMENNKTYSRTAKC